MGASMSLIRIGLVLFVIGLAVEQVRSIARQEARARVDEHNQFHPDHGGDNNGNLEM